MRNYLHVVVDHAGRGANREFAELPRVCPFCNRTAEPWRLEARTTDVDDHAVDFVFQCSRPECRRLFVGHYRLGADGEFELDGVGGRDQRAYAIHA